jgi:hypothetical protein
MAEARQAADAVLGSLFMPEYDPVTVHSTHDNIAIAMEIT